MTTLIAIDGPPGSGKTTKIIHDAAVWPEASAVVTYTNDATNTVLSRAPGIRAGTIYSLSWPFVRRYTSGPMRRNRKADSGYSKRRITSLVDPALMQYQAEAPSRTERKQWGPYAEMAPKLHAWGGPDRGELPFPLEPLSPRRQLTYPLPIARWLADGAPVPDEDRLDVIAIDEAQDVSALELAAAMALLKPGGVAYAYGDPGQAIFAEAKGIAGAHLPPVWEWADERQLLDGGYRVGDPVASAASRVLRSWYDRPADTFAADHTTEIIDWEPTFPPVRGLVLGYSRHMVAKHFSRWDLRDRAVVPHISEADKEVVICTGHAAKGGEADDVYLLPWSQKAMARLDRLEPGALRLLYVMLTRARRRLYIPRNLKGRIFR